MTTRIRPQSIAVVAAAALVAAPAALAAVPIGIGARNPSSGDAQKETQIIARTGVGAYGTRQSNLGTGGGAVYGCRSTLSLSALGNPDVSTPCVRVNNLADGKAFDFQFSRGVVGGVIQSGPLLTVANPKAAPFVTNATAIALGLNADQVDGKHAADIIKDARASAGLDAETVGGLTPAQIVASAKSAGAGTCGTDLVQAGDTCVEKAPRAAATFADASAVCGKAGRHLPTASVLTYARTLDGIDLGGGEMASDLTTSSSLLGGGSQAAYATVADNGTLGTAASSATTAYRCAQG